MLPELFLNCFSLDRFVMKKKTKQKEKGASMVEYALLAGLVAVVCIAAVTVLGQKTSQKFSSSAARIL